MRTATFVIEEGRGVRGKGSFGMIARSSDRIFGQLMKSLSAWGMIVKTFDGGMPCC